MELDGTVSGLRFEVWGGVSKAEGGHDGGGIERLRGETVRLSVTPVYAAKAFIALEDA